MAGVVRVISTFPSCSSSFAGDRNHMVRALAQPEDHFGHAMTQRAMVIDLGESEVFKRQMAHAVERRLDIGRSAPDFFQQRPQNIFSHPVK